MPTKKKTTHPRMIQHTKPDVSEWNLESVDLIKELFSKTILDAVNEALTYAVKETATVDVGGRYGDKPVNMLFEIPLSNYEDDPVVWSIPLSDICDGLLLEMADDPELDPSAIITAFREFADRLEAAHRNRKTD